MERIYCVCILTKGRNSVRFTGVTGDLRARIYQHREKLLPGFTNRYNASKLVYYETGHDGSGAIARRAVRGKLCLRSTQFCFVLNKFMSSCADLLRASTSLFRAPEGVGGRDKPGQDDFAWFDPGSKPAWRASRFSLDSPASRRRNS